MIKPTNIKVEDIKNKYPFVYELKERLYQIGQGVFNDNVTGLVLRYFEDYRTEISSIGREKLWTGTLEYIQVQDLVYNFRKVISYSDFDTKDVDFLESKEKINAFINALDEEEKNALREQIEDYIIAFKYYDMYK